MKNLLLLFVVISAFASCKKEDANNQIPEPSSSGKNFLACKVNGAVHRYSGLIDWMSPNGVSYSRFIDEVIIVGGSAEFSDVVGLHLKGSPDSLLPGYNYLFGGETNSNHANYTLYQSGTRSDLQYSTVAGSGWVRFSRVDTAVAAGTFAFTAYLNGQQGQDSIVITDGVFDIVQY